MNLLSVENISKAFGERVILENISFGINKDQKIAFIAKNGTGKTTLLNIMAGKDLPDSGQVVFRKGIHIGFLSQNPYFDEELTVEETIFAADNPILRLIQAYEHALEHPENEVAYQKAFEQMELHNAWDFETQYKQILFRLKLDNLSLKVKNLSGGQKKRLALANVLISKPDLLILDEPTNHLDLEMIEWLKKYFGKGIKLWYAVAEKGQEKEKKEVTYKATNLQTPKKQEVMPPSFIGKGNNHFAIPGIKKVNVESNLNPTLSFENFIEGESNKFAFTAAKAIADRPGQTSFNPLFIYGGVGVGKTHIAHGIGLEVKNKFPDKIVVYVPSEKFIQQFINVANTKNPEKRAEFANFYQMVDVLIIDDIQFLSGKKATQDTFFHIFDHLHQNGKQVVLTSDKAPVDIQDIEERIEEKINLLEDPSFDDIKNILAEI